MTKTSSGNKRIYTPIEKNIVISAMRYAMGSSTGVTEDTICYIRQHLDELGDEQFTVVAERDVREFLQRFKTDYPSQYFIGEWGDLLLELRERIEVNFWRYI